MRLPLSGILVVCCLTACAVAPGALPKRVAASSAGHPSSAPARMLGNTSASAQPSPVGSPIARARLDALIQALHDSLPASRASRMAPGLAYTTGMISDLGASIISNNGSTIISDNGGGIVSDNGGGIVSDNGGGLTSKTKYALDDFASAQAGATGAAQPAFPMPTFPEDADAESADTYYRIHMETMDTGYVKTYDRAKYHADKAGTEAAGPIDYFTWDSVAMQLVDESQGLIDLHVPLHKVHSTRLPFLDDLTSTQHRHYAPGTTSVFGGSFTLAGLELDYDMTIPLLDGKSDKAHFKAVCAGDDLIVSSVGGGMPESLPKRFKLTGTNSTGSYTGTSDYAADGVTTRVTHTAAGGSASDLELVTHTDGGYHETVTAHAANLRVTLDATADGKATGQVIDGTSGTGATLGRIAVDADGVATLTFESGEPGKARVF